MPADVTAGGGINLDRIPERLVEIWVENTATRTGKHGSGWVVRSTGVLTAAHLLPAGITPGQESPGTRIQVRPGRLLAPDWFDAEVRWLDRDADLALLAVTDPRWRAPRSAGSLISALGDRVQRDCEVVGFPKRERLASGQADIYQGLGVLFPADGARSSPTMRLRLDVVRRTAGASGWPGISGAAVRDQAGRLVGVVREAELDEPGTLLVTPVGFLTELGAYQNALAAIERRADERTVRTPVRHDVRKELREHFVTVLAKDPRLDEATRAELAAMLVDQLRLESAVPRLPQARSHCVAIVRACLERPEGAQALAEIHEEFAGPDNPENRRLHRLADEWDALEVLAEDEWLSLRALLKDVPLTALAHGADDALPHRTTEALAEFLPRPDTGRPTLPSYCATAWHALTYLLGDIPGPGELPSGMRFVEAVARAGSGQQAQDLQCVNRQWAVRIQLGADLDRHRFSSPRHPDATPSSYLVIQLEPYPLAPEILELTGHFQADPHGWAPVPAVRRSVARDQLGHAVEELVERLWESRPTPRVGLTLEFLLPLDLLDLPVEGLNDGVKPPLMARHSVVVRSLERARGELWHEAWQQRWLELVRRSSGCLLHWCEPEYPVPSEQLADEATDPRVVGAVLRRPPPLSHEELRTALKAGLPVLLWHRQGRYDHGFRQAVRELTAGDGLAHLPARARELRTGAFTPDDADAGPEWRRDAGRNLVLIWDDPGRLPALGARGRTG
jgi:hypothetical protein